MSYNSNFYINRVNHSTFHSNIRPHNVPPPPPPPPYFVLPVSTSNTPDEEYVKQFENLPLEQKHLKPKSISITEVKERLRNLVLTLNNLKDKQRFLEDQKDSLSEEEWASTIQKIEEYKSEMEKTLSNINSTCLDTLRKLLAKRSAKRLRLKRVKLERRQEKEQRIKELEERSRKIDENLQKIKDDIRKAKQDEEAKLQADIVLKEVLRKKNDAKKCIVKLDALIKLRKARQNTAKGRGENVSEKEAETFNSNIDKLKTLWVQKLALYEKEEATLQAKLKEDSKQDATDNEREREVLANLGKWRQFLFDGVSPQADFEGDVGRFVAVRSQWDQYLNIEGTPLPVGWVLPQSKTPLV